MLSCVCASLIATIPLARSNEVSDPWSATLYYGPSTTKFFGAVLQGFDMEPTGTMAGLALDRSLLDLGWDISIGGEVQVTQYFFGHKDTTVAGGLGLQFHDIFGFRRTDFSVYAGPSYATDPPYTSIGYRNVLWPSGRVKFLNFVGIEFASALPQSDWYGVFRIYHRSGMFGIYASSDDDGLAVGLGIQRRF
jgi:hypothetical protein